MDARACVLSLLLLCSAALADPAPAALPDTPAGRALGAWLDAFNSGDRARIETFVQTHSTLQSPDGVLRLRDLTGGFDLLAIEASLPADVIFRVHERSTHSEAIGRLKVNASEPPLVTGLRVFPVPAGAKFEAVTLDGASRLRIVERLATILNESYVFPDTAAKMATALRSNEKRGAYQGITDGEAFAARLTDELRNVSHDRHLEVRFSFVVQPQSEFEHPLADSAAQRLQLASRNCGFEKAEHLPPNIGYLKFNVFADPQICGATAAAAMGFVADSDALIIDLRDNHGGMSGMVTLLASYLFAEPTHLNDAYDRRQGTTTQFWTSSYVAGRRFVDKPVCVLTSAGTFSAAEDFSYALKNLKRATLIGEATGGGAHPIRSERIDNHFSVIVPFARSISPITRSDWEGSGVEPDVKVRAADALDEALKRCHP
jgi:hypothetical protein